METLEIFLTGAVILSTIFTIFLLSLSNVSRKSSPAKEKSSVQILVLGDIGRSPRMQYHALSIGKHGGNVQLIGYHESDIHPELLKHSSISILPIPPPPNFLQTSNRLLFLLFGPLKVIWQLLSICNILIYKAKPAKWLFVQNPPSIPTLFVCQIVCVIRNTHLLIDWHNFGYSILALKLGPQHPLVKLSTKYEIYFSRFATAHFTVTDAMSRVLREDFQVKAPIFSLHDRPPAHFQPFFTARQLEFLELNAHTQPYAQKLAKKSTRLVVSSTSWTPDEDFSILLEALVLYSSSISSQKSSLPDLLVIITGKGPQKAEYLRKIETLEANKKLEHVKILTAWLSAEDYAGLLASASIGISLHTSSSGVDLPMKVVDMFGTGLPVLGWSKFEAWPELVKEGVNGRGFGSAAELDTCLRELLGNPAALQKLRDGALLEGGTRWDDVWDPVAGRLLDLWD